MTSKKIRRGQMMKFYGYKIRVSCADWEQVEVLDSLWVTAAKVVNQEDLVSLGMEWKDDCFTYAIGALDCNILPADFENKLLQAGFNIKKINGLALPDVREWRSFYGKEKICAKSMKLKSIVIIDRMIMS